MFIVMHCMGIPFNGNTINERSLGGSESAAYYMAKQLVADGHHVTIFTNHPEGGDFDGVRYEFVGERTEQEPLGQRFHFYAANTPHDVCIIQRQPFAFNYKWASKINLLWLHDLALKRYAPQMQAAIHNITGVLTVSEYHKKQVCEVYGLSEDLVHPITNGIDLDLFTDEACTQDGIDAVKEIIAIDPDKKYLLYTSRPERGLEYLVRPNGIMHTLWEDGHKDIELLICGYDNTTEQMRPFYEQMWKAAEILPNVTNLGSLTKQQLASLQTSVNLHVYPTEFEEVSCITAMECMAAGLPFLSSRVAALPETCSVSKGCRLLTLENGKVNIKKFVRQITDMLEDPVKLAAMSAHQAEASGFYSWEMATQRLMSVVEKIFANRSDAAVMRELIRLSDIYAADKYLEKGNSGISDDLVQNSVLELMECYDFAWSNTFDEHYKAMYVREAERGINYGPERLDGNPRFEEISRRISELPVGATIMDYGCAHGHYTNTLAKRFPDKGFVGIDITLSNIEKARKWAEDEKLENVQFLHGRVDETGGVIVDLEQQAQAVSNGLTIVGTTGIEFDNFDAIIAAEVIEHVASPDVHVDALHYYLKDGGLMLLTTPYGPWEAIGYREHHPWRAHLWHFERADLYDLWGHFDNFGVSCVPSGTSKEGDPIGSYITAFTKTDACSSAEINYRRKFSEIKPRETVSLCMIAKDAADTILRTLESLQEVVDEVRVFIDPATTDNTREVVERFADQQPRWPLVTIEDLPEKAVDSGFDQARNESISKALGDWVMWIDSDEYVSYPERLPGYLRDNGLNGYALKQHHFSLEPVGVMKTDYPVRLFRNHKGVKFFGVVHEHPELELNKGVGHAWLIPNVDIAHTGYTNEKIRRERFGRNIDLMKRDRDAYPSRTLGKFLWIRDLSQMIGYNLEQVGRLTENDLNMAAEGIRLWDELIEDGQVRMLTDGVQFYSRLVQALGTGFEFSFKIDTNRNPGGTNLDTVQPITGFFRDKQDAERFFTAILNERVIDYGHKYE